MGQSDILLVPGNRIIRRWQLIFLRFLMRFLFRIEVSGLKNVPPAGPLVIVINHIAFLDPVLVLGLLPRLATPMAKVETFRSWLWRWFVKGYGTIPVHREEGDMQSVKSALRILKQGGAVLLAPEGTRSRTYQLQRAKDGAVILALRSNAQILPVGVTGTQRVKTHLLKLKRPPLTFSIGKPFRVEELTSNNSRPSRQEIGTMTTQMMCRLAAQLPPEYRGVYSNANLEAVNITRSGAG